MALVIYRDSLRDEPVIAKFRLIASWWLCQQLPMFLSLVAVSCLVVTKVTDPDIRSFAFQMHAGEGFVPVDLPAGKRRSLHLLLRFTPRSIDIPNLLTTGKSGNSLRLSVMRPGKLAVTVPDRDSIVLAPKITPGEEHVVGIVVDDEAAMVQLVGHEPECFNVPGGIGRLDLRRFVMGAGVFSVTESNTSPSTFSMTLKYERPNYRLLGMVGMLLVAVVLGKLRCGRLEDADQIEQPLPWAATAQMICGTTIALTCGMAGYCAWPKGGRWVGFLVVGVGILAAIAIDNPACFGFPTGAHTAKRWLSNRGHALWRSVCLATSRHKHVVGVLPSLALITIAFVSAYGLDEFANWEVAAASYRKNPILFAGSFSIIQAFALWLCLWPQRAAEEHSLDSPKPSSRMWLWLACATGAVAATVLAFRADALFEGSSAFHWAYYVGPVQMLRHGGALLLDQPSQYGLLNILLVSAFPHPSPWQSFYVVQSLLLLGCAMAGFRTVTGLRTNLAWSCGMCFCWLLILFFAHPALIGPQPYPSGSVMRFLPCYLMLSLAVKPLRIGRATFGPIAAWAIGLLWAAETALYCSVAAAAFVVGCSSGRDRWERALRSGGAWAAIGAIVIVAFSILCRLVIGCWPDWRMYTMYAAAYGVGFPEFTLAFPSNGAWLFVVMLLVAMIVACRAIRVSDGGGAKCGIAALATALAWAVCSYYVGRPVQTNVMALAPLLVMCAVCVVACAGRTRSDASAAPLRCALFPFMVMFLMSTIGSEKFYEVLRGMTYFTRDVTARLPRAAGGLVEAIDGIRLAADEPWVYYGTEALAPPVPGRTSALDRPWLPMPLQALQSPITTVKRDEIISRRTEGYSRGGVFIYSMDYAATKAGKEWIRFLDGVYLRLDAYAGECYGAIRYGSKQPLREGQ